MPVPWSSRARVVSADLNLYAQRATFMTRPRSVLSAARRGTAALAWVAGVLGLALVGLSFWLASTDADSHAPSQPTVEARAADAPPTASSPERAAARVSEAKAPALESAAPPPVIPLRTGRLKLEVLDSAGAALAQLPVYATCPGSPPVEVATDFSGLADFASLEAGAWRVRIGGPQHPLVPELAIELLEDAIVTHRAQLPVALVELDVEVLDEAGRPAPNVALKARCERGGEPRATTDSAGRATLRHVQPGPVRVFANDEQLGRANRIVELEAGQRASVQLALRRRS